MQGRNGNHPEYYNLRPQLKEAFKRIRRKQLYARMNFLCCSTCASYDFYSKLNNSDRKLGYVFWHSQDEDSFQRRGYVYLGFGCRDNDDEAFKKRVGQMIVDTLKEMDIPHDWDGDADQKILVGVHYD